MPDQDGLRCFYFLVFEVFYNRSCHPLQWHIDLDYAILYRWHDCTADIQGIALTFLFLICF